MKCSVVNCRRRWAIKRLDVSNIGRSIHGVTILEVLIVVAVISVLAGLALPSIMRCREIARLTQCRNNVKQSVFAWALHADAHSHYPINGWGHQWVGDASRGYGTTQPGGWAFNILPFLEANEIRTLGQGIDSAEAERNTARLLGSTLPVFYCPTRRAARTYPWDGSYTPRNAMRPRDVCKLDYAVCAGDVFVSSGPGPLSYDPVDISQYRWPNSSIVTGVGFVRLVIRPADIVDGLSTTYCLGEKYVPAIRPALLPGDDQSAFIGDDADIRRWTDGPILNDFTLLRNKRAFGSSHTGVAVFGFLDGSVHSVSISIDARIHRCLGNRKDGQLINADSL